MQMNLYKTTSNHLFGVPADLPQDTRTQLMWQFIFLGNPIRLNYERTTDTNDITRFITSNTTKLKCPYAINVV